jgi:hypothetical protein
MSNAFVFKLRHNLTFIEPNLTFIEPLQQPGSTCSWGCRSKHLLWLWPRVFKFHNLTFIEPNLTLLSLNNNQVPHVAEVVGANIHCDFGPVSSRLFGREAKAGRHVVDGRSILFTEFPLLAKARKKLECPKIK